ncbi:MAG TPA: hypothetical protein VKB80_24630 [Kofleriaceae bacterium]|nr:hypothetical protein [Kofleriaceae bacterium]
MRRSCAILLGCIALSAALAPVAGAGPAGRAEPKLVREARKHKSAGLEHLKRHHLTRAIEELQIAYGLSPDPDVLYHLGQAYNARQEYPQALYYYRAYRDKDPAGARRRGVDQIIEALIALGAAGPPESQPAPSGGGARIEERRSGPPVGPESGPAEAQTPAGAGDAGSSGAQADSGPQLSAEVDAGQAAIDQAGSGKRLAGLATMSLGLAAAGAGLYFAAVSDRTADHFDGGSELRSENRDERRNGIILMGAGGAAVAAGALVYVLGRFERGNGTHIAVTPSSSGFALSLAGGF